MFSLDKDKTIILLENSLFDPTLKDLDRMSETNYLMEHLNKHQLDNVVVVKLYSAFRLLLEPGYDFLLLFGDF